MTQAKGAAFAVFGAGRQGLAAIYDLVRFCGARRVFVGEPDEKRAHVASARLGALLGEDARRVSFAPDIDESDLKSSDVVLSCAPYTANLALARRALGAGVHFCDLGGNPGVVAAQERAARGARTAVIPECGVSPGLSNILAAHLARDRGCDEVHVRCGGIPARRPSSKRNPLGYKLVFSARGLVSEYSGDVPVLRAGRYVTVPALSVVENLMNESGEALECSPTSNNAPHVARFLLQCGVRDYDYMTIRHPGHWKRARAWRKSGALSGNTPADERLIKKLDDDKVLRYVPGRDRDRILLIVRGKNRKLRGLAQTHELRLDVTADTSTGFSAMELSTSWGITIVADALARKRVGVKGFATPERVMDGAFVLKELSRRLEALQR